MVSWAGDLIGGAGSRCPGLVPLQTFMNYQMALLKKRTEEAAAAKRRADEAAAAKRRAEEAAEANKRAEEVAKRLAKEKLAKEKLAKEKGYSSSTESK